MIYTECQTLDEALAIIQANKRPRKNRQSRPLNERAKGGFCEALDVELGYKKPKNKITLPKLKFLEKAE